MNRVSHLLPTPRPEPRWEKIRALRLAIARGDYETEHRWEVTLKRLLNDVVPNPLLPEAA